MENTSANTSNYIRPVIIIIVLLFIEIQILDYLFPYPGFKAIISFPMIFGICSVIIILGIFLAKKLNNKLQIALWIIIFIINSLITAHLYPQDGGQNALRQVRYTFNVVGNYKTITVNDLELYTENEYDAFDNSVPDDKERYVAALYKFRNEINRDGSNFIYGDRDKPILVNTNIEKHFDNGQDKLIWWLLETFKKDE